MIETDSSASQSQAITTALFKANLMPERVDPTTWICPIPGAADTRYQLKLDDDWLTIKTSLPDSIKQSMSTSLDLWKFLDWNGRLRGGIKFAYTQAAPLWQVRTEIPLAISSELDRWVTSVLRGFKQVFAAAARDRRGLISSRRINPVHSRSGAPIPTDLRELCEQTGWNFTQRRGGAVFVELEVPGEFCQAQVGQDRSHVVGVAISLGPVGVISKSSRQAMGLLLLRVCSHLRMVRAIVKVDAKGLSELMLEVILPGSPSSDVLVKAFSALSLGCRLCIKEIHSLKQKDLADAYLAMQKKDGRGNPPRNE